MRIFLIAVFFLFASAGTVAAGTQVPPEILSACQQKWGTDYSMVEYCVNKQMTAKRALGLH